MTLSRYLKTVEMAYDAVFKDLRDLPPIQKYRKKADGRHGGLLDLPAVEARAFAEWFHSRRWSGSHPWEIVFGHPHGIMISPKPDEARDRWSFALWVDSMGWYAPAARMAMALGERQIPVEVLNHQAVLDALKGVDEVEVGPDLYMVHFDDLKNNRPDALRSIRWDPIPQLSPITPDQAARIPSIFEFKK